MNIIFVMQKHLKLNLSPNNIMGKKWNLLILIAIYEDIHTFSGIMKAIPQINTSILTKRLNELVNKGFITKTAKNGYNLSEK